MSGLVRQVEGGDPGKGPRPPVLTSERWLAVVVLAAFGGLVLARRAFSEFIPR